MHEDLLKKLRELLLKGDTESALGLIESAIGDLEIPERVCRDKTAREREMLPDGRQHDRESAVRQAKQLVEKAKVFLQTVGKDIAFAEISKPGGAFKEGEKYVFVLDMDGIMLAHGENWDFVGLDFKTVKDLEGRDFIRDMIETANEKGHGTVEYIWFHPISRSYENKIVYFEKVDSMIICSGVYMGQK